MPNRKYIISHVVSGIRLTNAYLIAGHYNRSLRSYKALVAEAMMSLPGIKEDDAECLVVTRSRWCCGCPAIRIRLGQQPEDNPKAEIEGWTNTDFDRLDVEFN